MKLYNYGSENTFTTYTDILYTVSCYSEVYAHNSFMKTIFNASKLNYLSVISIIIENKYFLKS